MLGWSVLDATERLHVPAVAFCHSDLPALMARLVGGPLASGSRRGRWAERRAADYLARLYARFDLVLAPSRAMTRRLREIGVSHAQHQPLGVDCSVFSPAANAPRWRERLLEALALAPDTRLLAYAGRFAPEEEPRGAGRRGRPARPRPRAGRDGRRSAAACRPQRPRAAAGRLAPGGAAAGQRRRVRPRRQPGDLRAGRAGGDGLRHAGRRPRRRRPGRARARRRHRRPVAAARGLGRGDAGGARALGLAAGVGRHGARARDWGLIVEQWAARYRQGDPRAPARTGLRRLLRAAAAVVNRGRARCRPGARGALRPGPARRAGQAARATTAPQRRHRAAPPRRRR
ncbi:MAG: glycosyltransferase [Comamonadaceae bacterium]|nr:glycosyltransferase [Comamonadaceae bacterium]